MDAYIYTMEKIHLKVIATEYIDWFPGFLKCELIDLLGKKHEFTEKVPVVCGAEAYFDQASLYPVEITFPGNIIHRSTQNGIECYTISLLQPYDISSEEGEQEFKVSKDQLIF